MLYAEIIIRIECPSDTPDEQLGSLVASDAVHDITNGAEAVALQFKDRFPFPATITVTD